MRSTSKVLVRGKCAKLSENERNLTLESIQILFDFAGIKKRVKKVLTHKKGKKTTTTKLTMSSVNWPFPLQAFRWR